MDKIYYLVEFSNQDESIVINFAFENTEDIDFFKNRLSSVYENQKFSDYTIRVKMPTEAKEMIFCVFTEEDKEVFFADSSIKSFNKFLQNEMSKGKYSFEIDTYILFKKPSI